MNKNSKASEFMNKMINNQFIINQFIFIVSPHLLNNVLLYFFIILGE